MSTIDSALEVIRLISEAEDFSEIACPECGGRLVIHQPDERLPERLLGTCRSCTGWFVIDAVGGMALRLPHEFGSGRLGMRPKPGRLDRSSGISGGSHRLDGPADPARGGRRRRATTGRDGGSRPVE